MFEVKKGKGSYHSFSWYERGSQNNGGIPMSPFVKKEVEMRSKYR